MENKLSTEVVIVGGGPAGVSAAFTLGKLGISTIVVDKKSMDKIGDKVCGDALSPNYYNYAHEMIGLPKPDKEAGELLEIVEETVLIGKDDKSKIVLTDGSATVDRLKYGQKLIKSLDQFPHVEVRAAHRTLDVIIENNYLVGIICLHENNKVEIRSKLVIDASGAIGIVRKLLPQDMIGNRFPRKLPRNQLIVAFREIIRTKKNHPYQHEMLLAYEPEIDHIMPGYYWYFSRGEKELNIGLGYIIYDNNRGQNIRKINEKVRKRRFPDAEVVASQGDIIPARLPLPSCVHNGFLTVGDAAALANPMNGEGHGVALVAGVYAGKYVAKAIQDDDVSEEFLWDYNKFIWKKYGVINSWGIAIIKFVLKWGFEAFDWLMAKGILQEDDIIEMNKGPNVKLNFMSRALKGWYRPKILLSLRRVVKLARSIQHHALDYPDIEEFDKWLLELNRLENQDI